MYSVIIPVYEARDSLDRCVKSWLAQTEGDLELLLVDDGSTDGSRELCEKWAKKDARVRVLHQKNAGVSAARNAGIDAARGEHMFFTDSDDYVAPDYLEKMEQCMKASGAELVLCGFHHLYEGADIQKLPKRPGVFSIKEGEEDFLCLYEQSFLNMPWNKLYIRELAGRFDPSISLGEDLLFNLDYLERCRNVAVLAEPLCYYIQEEKKISLSSKKRLDRLGLARKICRETEDFYDRHWESGSRAGHGRIFTRYMNEVLDECEKLPSDKSLTRKEKLQIIRAYGEDEWVRTRGEEAGYPYLDYRILWFFLKRQRAGSVYGLCVLRRGLAAFVHWIRRKGRMTVWNH